MRFLGGSCEVDSLVSVIGVAFIGAWEPVLYDLYIPIKEKEKLYRNSI